MQIESCCLHDDGCLVVSAVLNGGVVFQMCYGAPLPPALEAAVARFKESVGAVVELTMLESVPTPEIPDVAPDPHPCRVCDRRTPQNRSVGQSTYCPDHAPAQ